jgi:hypothetical protein
MSREVKDWRVELQDWLKTHPKTMPDDLQQLRHRLGTSKNSFLEY